MRWIKLCDHVLYFFFFNDTATTEIYTLSLHDALPIFKANLPTRISFAVTSKIDSRTILGEQGAEQLLGKGDMLYMPGGKQIARVHGPFVTDEEVRAVADHWRSQGTPEYVMAVTEEPEDGGYMFEGQPIGEDDAE